MHGGNVWQGQDAGYWLDFSANIDPEGPEDWVLKALKDALKNISYYPDPDMIKAREALGAYLGMDPEWTLPTEGGVQAIDLVSRLEAKVSVVFAPSFNEYADMSRANGKKVRAVQLIRKQHEMDDPVRALRDVIERNSIIWFCNPCNPTGVVLTREGIAELLYLAEQNGCFLVIDEAFIHCCPEMSSLDLIKEHEKLIIIGSMTKRFAIPGVRLGYIAAHPEIAARLKRISPPWALNCFAEAVLRRLASHCTENDARAEMNESRREWLRAELERLGAFVYPSRASFLLADMGEDAARLARELKKKGILIRECMDFAGIDDGRHIRLAVKDEVSNKRLIEAIREAKTCEGNH